METIIVALISGLCVAVPNIFATILTNKKDTIGQKLNSINVNFNNKLSELSENLEKEKLDRAKSDLVVIMSRIRNGYEPTVEEKIILHETKQKYNSLGGNSYVDDMFDNLKKEGKI